MKFILVQFSLLLLWTAITNTQLKSEKSELFPGFIAQNIGKTLFTQGFLEIQLNMQCPDSLYLEIRNLYNNLRELLKSHLPYLQTRYTARFSKTQSNSTL